MCGSLMSLHVVNRYARFFEVVMINTCGLELCQFPISKYSYRVKSIFEVVMINTLPGLEKQLCIEF